MRVAVIGALAACTHSPPPGPTISHTPLAHLHGTVVHASAASNAAAGGVEGYFDAIINTTSDDCTALAADATATFQGVAIPIADSYIAEDGSCHTIELGPTGIDSALYATQPVQLVIADATATWTISFVSDSTFTLPAVLADGTTVTSTWPNGPEITQGCVQMTKPQSSPTVAWIDECAPSDLVPPPVVIEGNELRYTVPSYFYQVAGGTVDLSLWAQGSFTVAAASSTGPSCDGPAKCLLDVQAEGSVSGISVTP